ncbi:MAG: hypothetical protein KDD83_14085 [Caldilineaceae bacterium]|nr:hypothetical protein [Caldilineaceae bacterium]
MGELYEIPLSALVLLAMPLFAIVVWMWTAGVRHLSKKEEGGKGWSQLERKVREVRAEQTEDRQH